jgi:hypothetical protein
MPERVFTFLQNVVTAWFLLLLGFFAVWRRPPDRMAWLVLLIMIGQLNYAYVFFTLFRATHQMWLRVSCE